ncbi:lipopolysaccharide-induced tumor necrosis factor-alpha factor homolog [Onthophagus taurus]|uniref:lipopolysaccharide-induced tumor necrosis factor-alpha factor homolog n=1 Tax=Onthophagus taurus TaxID=166361 RepID=UPI000C206AA3|nr:lipopolysaccharide-induced tumor necrosis factor-alpha factor homolog [Onthophagus taurus]
MEKMEKPLNPPEYTPHPQHPPPLGFVPPQPHVQTTTVVMEQAVHFGPKCQNVTCPQCRHQILTRTESKSTTRTHLYALLLCLFGCWPCVCIPYCVDSCMNTDHYCPNCNAFLGTYQS